MTRRFCLLLLSVAAAAQIAKPRIGYMVDRERCLRAVEGVAGAFTVGPVLETDILSAAFSGKTLVVKKADQVRVNDRTFDAPDGPITVVFDRTGNAAEIYFREAGVLWTWRDGAFTSTPAHGVITDVFLHRGELIVNGIPLRLGWEPREVSQLGEGWLVVYSDACAYALRGEQMFELPEGSGE
jgi:hypothetical protein